MTLRNNSCDHEIDRRRKLLHIDELDHVSVAVDVGTGDGFSALALLDISDYVIALDSDWTHLTEYTRPQIAGKRILLLQADFLHLPVRSIDLYCSFGSWQHALMHQSSTEKLKKTISEAHACLKSDGTLLLAERMAFFDDWQPKNSLQEHQRMYYLVIENLFNPPIFGRSLLSNEEFFQMIEEGFQILATETVHDKGILSDAFFENVRKRELTREVENHVEFLAEHRETEDPMIRIMARRRKSI